MICQGIPGNEKNARAGVANLIVRVIYPVEYNEGLILIINRGMSPVTFELKSRIQAPCRSKIA